MIFTKGYRLLDRILIVIPLVKLFKVIVVLYPSFMCVSQISFVTSTYQYDEWSSLHIQLSDRANVVSLVGIYNSKHTDEVV